MKDTLKTHVSKSLILIMIMFMWGCKKFVFIDYPTTSLTGSSVFMDESTATAALLNIYHDMSVSDARPFQGEYSLSWMSGLMADEFKSYFNDNRKEFAEHIINPENTIVQSNWSALYEAIYATNLIIEQIQNSGKLSSLFKESLEGEARFLRGLMYFYLVNFWEQVPLVLKSDYNQNRLLAQSTKEEIYIQIIEDLRIAQEMLKEQYSSIGRIRPNKFTATALLAKVYLHTQQEEKAIQAASAIIEHEMYHLEDDLNQVFLNVSKEVIWRIEPVYPNVYSWEAYRFVLIFAPTRVTASESLLEAFGKDDQRKDKWIGKFTTNGVDYFFPNKYKVRRIPDHPGAPPESFVMFRLSEQYLIRAECKARMGDLAGATLDLNKVRNRAGLESVESNNLEILLEMIVKERRVELFTEGCNRWFDLKRLNKVKTMWLPIPENELLYSPTLVQNPGY